MIVQLLEVLIGLVLVYLIFSTIASSLVEVVEMVAQKRGKFLEQGIREILAAFTPPQARNQGKTDADLGMFYESPFVSSLFREAYKSGSKKLPSYIPPERFADAIWQLATKEEGGGNTFQRIVTCIKSTMKPEAAADDAQAKTQCINYFNQSMERVSGWYQHFARCWLIAIGFVIAFLGNIDTLQLIDTLSQDETLRAQIVEEATRAQPPDASAPKTIEEQRIFVGQQLQLVGSLGLPIGWNRTEACRVFGLMCAASGDADAKDGKDSHNEVDQARQSAPTGDADDKKVEQKSPWRLLAILAPFLSKLFGVLLTTVALVFGAPFWFDLLNELVNLRASLKPKATESDETTVAPDTKPKSQSPQSADKHDTAESAQK